MEKYQNYSRTILGDIEESLSKIVNKIRPGSLVLDVGCGTGMLGEYLTSKKDCIVDGVDADVEAVSMSSKIYRTTAVKNLETELLTDAFKVASYDFIVVADVIEHLSNPDSLLAELQKLIKPGGTVIFSVPNVTHLAVGLELLAGNFKYSNNGLLDNTHVKFYSKESLLAKLGEFDFVASEIDTVKKTIAETEFTDHISKTFPQRWLEELIATRPDALTYQWLVSARPGLLEKQDVALNFNSAAPLLYSSNLFWADANATNLTEENMLIGRLTKSNPDFQVIDFCFADVKNGSELKTIRIDPVSDAKPFFIGRAEILDQNNVVAWTWDPSNSESEICGARVLRNFGAQGCLFEAVGTDPQWLPKIPAEVLNRIHAGWVFRFCLKVDAALLTFQLFEDNKMIAQRDGQILGYQQQVAELHNQITNIYNSKSWRLTRPLRELSLVQKKIAKLGFLYQKYRHLYPGFTGHIQLVYKCLMTIWSGGISGLRNKVSYYENSHKHSSLNPQIFSAHKVLMLEESLSNDQTSPGRVAVHIHAFYPELIADISNYLKCIPTKFSLYVTTDTPQKAAAIEEQLAPLPQVAKVEVHVSENRGRDIFPMLVTLGAKLSEYDLVLHIHTKRSPHNSLELSGWRRYLMESLLGGAQRVSAIFGLFSRDKDLGILFPDYYHPIKPFIYRPEDESNDRSMKNLLVRAGKKKSEFEKIDRTLYPAGDMFWFRGKAIRPLVDMQLSVADFEIESGQVNGTLAHAIERMFPYFAGLSGLKTLPFLAKSFQSVECSSHTLDLFVKYQNSGTLVKPSVLFDHNGGGGTNIYTRELIAEKHQAGGSVLRIYCFNAVWYLQWLAPGDGMLFHTDSTAELFGVLERVGVTHIEINSLYGYPDIELAVGEIIKLAKNLNIGLDFKVHDFFSLCPSPHLSDSEGKYCGVPKDASVCRKCLKKNNGWYHHWYPKEKRPSEIADWRRPFAELLEAATQVTFFDRSSIEIAQRVFKISDEKISLIPHKMEYLETGKAADLSGPIRLGVLGALSQIKGGDVVSALYYHLEKNKVHLPITIVGPSIVNTPKKIIVHGFYNQQELPAIIDRYGINVVLMPSIVPETFSYTISEAIKLELPIVAFDLGAQGNRVKEYAKGKVIPLGSDSEQILEALQQVLTTARELNK